MVETSHFALPILHTRNISKTTAGNCVDYAVWITEMHQIKSLHNSHILPQMMGADGMNSVARLAGLYMAAHIPLEAENMTDIEHPACLNPGPVMHISTAKMEVTRIPTTLELDTSAKIKHEKDTRLTN